MLMKIVPYTKWNKKYQSLDYLAFREKLVEVINMPDLATAYLNALWCLFERRDKTTSCYKHRLRLLVFKAHPDLAHITRKKFLMNRFYSDSTTANSRFPSPLWRFRQLRTQSGWLLKTRRFGATSGLDARWAICSARYHMARTLTIRATLS